jgi:uroporphyrinogen decarboxylase
MTSREIVYRAIERRDPPRVPLIYCNRDFEDSDVIGTGPGGDPAFQPSEPGMTEFGYVWGSLDATMGQPHDRPLADWSRIDDYVPPDPYAPGRFDHLAAWCAQEKDRFRTCGASIAITGFNNATFLRGYEDFMMDLALHPDRVERVLDIVFGVENGLIDRAIQFDIDCIKFGDDWGTQNGLMVSLDSWRKVFKPRYADQFARIRAAGKKVWFHSCGNVYAILGDLIEIGVDVLELLQPDIFGIDRLAQDFGGDVCFCCSVDHQRVAVPGTRDEIFAYARKLVDTLGAFHGGFIAYIEDYSSLGMTEQNYQWIREAFHEYCATPPR